MIQNDERIDLKALKQGKKSAFETVYFEFFDLLYHLCLQYVGDETTAEEIVQDSFVKLWEVREQLKPDTNIRNFLFTVTKNRCLNHLRQEEILNRNHNQIRYLEMQFNYEALGSLADGYLNFEELKEKIDLAIGSLPDDLKETFLLNRFEDMRYKDIALKMDISQKTVEARMSKALKILRKELKEYLCIIYLISDILM